MPQRTPTFSQEHYESLAEFIQALPETDRYLLAAPLAGWLSLDNSRFDHNKWYRACGFELSGVTI